MRARVGTQLESVARIRNNMLSPSADGGLVLRFGFLSQSPDHSREFPSWLGQSFSHSEREAASWLAASSLPALAAIRLP
jgi:hypothetical protein